MMKMGPFQILKGGERTGDAGVCTPEGLQLTMWFDKGSGHWISKIQKMHPSNFRLSVARVSTWCHIFLAPQLPPPPTLPPSLASETSHPAERRTLTQSMRFPILSHGRALFLLQVECATDGTKLFCLVFDVRFSPDA